MTKKNRFNKSNNPLQYLGRPFFLFLVYFTTIVSFIFLIFVHLPRRFHLPKVKISTPKFKVPSFSLPSLPKLHFPKVSFANIRISKIHLLQVTFPRLKFNPRLVFIFVVLTVFFSFSYMEFFNDLPNPKNLSEFPSKLTTKILDRNGVLLYKIYKDENRTLIDIHSLPDYVLKSFLAAEDKDFYNHIGFSPTGVIRAFLKNLSEEKLEGGSTITQQLVKNTLLSNEKTLTRKIKELILAIQIEHLYTKDEIFEMYLNQVGFGGPAYGIQEASRQYFNIDAKDLTLPQAAFLAGLPQAPSKYSPYGANPELSITRQRFVLAQMLKDGFILEDQYQEAINTKLVFGSARIEIKAPHFVMFVKDILTQMFGENVVTQGGLTVTTTLDSTLQDKAQDIVSKEIASLKHFHVTNGSALVTNPSTGEILAMVGSKDYFNLNEDGQVNLTTSLRQPGSSIKPINYALAFENGYTPGSVIEDKPFAFNLPGSNPWIPKNYDGRFHGFVTLRQALGSSYNIPSVLLLSKNGVTNFANFAQKLGILSWNDPSRFGLSMALGSLEVRMVDLAQAYSTFANQGITTPLTSILKIEKPNQEKLFISACLHPTATPENAIAHADDEKNCSPHQVVSPSTAYLITDILSDNSARAPAFGANSVLNVTKAKVAVKTGTSNDLKDNWAIGYTKNYLVATWVGNNDNAPMSRVASGITGASPMWAKIMNHIIEKDPQPKEIVQPQNMVRVAICTLTGTLTCSGCPTRYELFPQGSEPKTACNPEHIKKILNPSPTPSTTPSPQIL